MGLVRMGRPSDRSRTLLLLLIVIVVLVYLWNHDSGADEDDHDDDHDVSKSGDKRRFVMVSMTTKETSYDHMSISNKFQYAEKHGYQIRYDFKGPLGIWDKITDVENVVKENKYDWIWWLDHDALITNSSIRLQDVVDDALSGAKNPDEIDLILTPDCFPLNDGSMLIRSTPWVLDLFKHVWKCGDLVSEDGHHYSEQDCIRDQIKDNIAHARDKSILIKQWKLNAFPEEIKCYDSDNKPWEQGMFVIHFAGAWAHVKNEKDPVGFLMRKYYPMIV